MSNLIFCYGTTKMYYYFLWKARENIVQLQKQFTTDKLNVQLQNAQHNNYFICTSAKLYVGIVHSFSTSAKESEQLLNTWHNFKTICTTAKKNAKWQFSFALLAKGRQVTYGILSSAPEARNLLCSANTELRRHNFQLVAFLFFALLAKLRNQELVLFLADSVNRQCGEAGKQISHCVQSQCSTLVYSANLQILLTLASRPGDPCPFNAVFLDAYGRYLWTYSRVGRSFVVLLSSTHCCAASRFHRPPPIIQFVVGWKTSNPPWQAWNTKTL